MSLVFSCSKEIMDDFVKRHALIYNFAPSFCLERVGHLSSQLPIPGVDKCAITSHSHLLLK